MKRIHRTLTSLALVASAGYAGDALANIYHYDLYGPNVGFSASGTNWIALPAVTDTPTAIATCGDLQTVVNNGVSGNVGATVWRFERTTDVSVQCTCPGGPDCFAIIPGEGYQVKVTADTAIDVTGTDQFVVIPLIAQAAGQSLSGTNQIAIPYNSTLLTANDVRLNIGPKANGGVAKLLIATDTLQTYTGKGAGLNFVLTKGEGYRVRITGTADQYWVPAGGVGTSCASQAGSFPMGLTAAGLAASFCSQWTDPNYSCNQVPAGTGTVVVLTYAAGGSCVGSIIVLTFVVPGGTTLADHPYGYQVCCNSPLSNKMGSDGARVTPIDNTTRSFGEFSVTSSQGVVSGSTPAPVPALGTVGMAGLAAALLLIGAYFVWRSSSVTG